MNVYWRRRLYAVEIRNGRQRGTARRCGRRARKGQLPFAARVTPPTRIRERRDQRPKIVIFDLEKAHRAQSTQVPNTEP